MNYQSEIFTKCKNIVETQSKYNLTKHLKPIENLIMEETSTFPSDISLSMRARAIASQSLCQCQNCGKVHGNPDGNFCSHKCYLTDKAKSKTLNIVNLLKANVNSRKE